MASKLTGFLGGYGGLEKLEKIIGSWDLNDFQKEMIRSYVKKKGCSGLSCSR